MIAGAKGVTEKTLEELGVPKDAPMSPEMTRIAFSGGAGGPKRGLIGAVRIASAEEGLFLAETPLRLEAKQWADCVLTGQEILKTGAVVTPREGCPTDLPSLLSSYKQFIGGTAGKRALPGGLRTIPRSVESDPDSAASRKTLEHLLGRWQPIAQHVIDDWERWADVPFVTVEEWILNAFQQGKASLSPEQRLMRPITKLETTQMAAVKQHLFLLDLRRVFNPPATLKELEELENKATAPAAKSVTAPAGSVGPASSGMSIKPGKEEKSPVIMPKAEGNHAVSSVPPLVHDEIGRAHV